MYLHHNRSIYSLYLFKAYAFFAQKRKSAIFKQTYFELVLTERWLIDISSIVLYNNICHNDNYGPKGHEMAQVLFCLIVLFEVGMVLIPLTSATRGRAVWGWFSNFLGIGALSHLIEMNYPSWAEPRWHQGNLWALIAWLLFIVGFIVAICKPLKRNLPVA